MAVVDVSMPPTRYGEATPARRLATTISAYDSLPTYFAGRYDNVDTASLRRDFIRRLPTDRRPVLDAGCGTGRDLIGFQSAGLRVVGLDLSAGLLSVASSKAKGCPLVRADVRSTPFPSQTFRGTWAMASLVHLDRPAIVQALRELRRTLIPEGVLLATFILGVSDGWRTDPCDERRWFSRHSGRDVRRLALEAGFRVEETEVTTGSIGGEWINLFARPATETDGN